MCASLIRQTLKIKNPRCYPGVAVVMQRGGGDGARHHHLRARDYAQKRQGVNMPNIYARALLNADICGHFAYE